MEYKRYDLCDVIDVFECVRLTEIPHSELQLRVLPSGCYKREVVLEALCVSPISIEECITTRGKTSEEGAVVLGLCVEEVYLWEGMELTTHVAKSGCRAPHENVSRLCKNSSGGTL